MLKDTQQGSDRAGPGLQPPNGCCSGASLLVPRGKKPWPSLPLFPGKNRNPGSCGDLSHSATRHRPGAKRSHCCHWPLQLTLLSHNSHARSPPRGRSSTSSCLDLSSLQLPSVPRQSDSKRAAPGVGLNPIPHFRPMTGQGALKGQILGDRPLPPPQQFIPPLPCSEALFFKK